MSIALPWTPSTDVVVGQSVANAGNKYQCITAGVTNVSGGPTGQGSSIADGTAVWSWVSQAWGLMPQGWVGKSLGDVVSSLTAAFKAGPLGESAGTEPDGSIPAASLAGQLIAIMADGLGDLWDLLQSVYSSFDPAQATASALDVLCSLTGTLRESGTYSTVVGTCTGTATTVVTAGLQAKVTGTGTLFAVETDATITSVTAYSGTATPTASERVTVGGSVYQCTGVTAASSNGLDGTQRGTGIVDGGATWTYLGPGNGAVDVTFQATATGPLQATPGSLATIVTPILGWSGVYNLAAANQGTSLESDGALRLRRTEALHSTGNAAADAIRAAVLAIPETDGKNVLSCFVYFNDQDTAETNAQGVTMPPHSVCILVDYGAITSTGPGSMEDAIAHAIWGSVAAGIQTSTGGADSASNNGSPIASTVTDGEGNTQTVYWVRPSLVNVPVTATVTYDNTPGVFPTTGAQLIADAIVTAGDAYPIGKDVYPNAIIAAIFDGPTDSNVGTLPVPGILDVTVTAPTGKKVMTAFQRATLTVASNAISLQPAAP